MSTNSPILLEKVRSTGSISIHLVKDKSDLNSISEIAELKEKIASESTKKNSFIQFHLRMVLPSL
ncbi:MAG: hypothetical protein JKX84_05015 [Flavobacteriales bacterium]|nr:hypothetical protein [Flavobacteriales bacterium]